MSRHRYHRCDVELDPAVRGDRAGVGDRNVSTGRSREPGDAQRPALGPVAGGRVDGGAVDRALFAYTRSFALCTGPLTPLTSNRR